MQVHARHAPPNSHDMSSGPAHSASDGQSFAPPPVVGSSVVTPWADVEVVSEPDVEDASLSVLSASALSASALPSSVLPSPELSPASVAGSALSGDPDAEHPRRSAATKSDARVWCLNTLGCIAALDGRRAELLAGAGAFSYFFSPRAAKALLGPV